MIIIFTAVLLFFFVFYFAFLLGDEPGLVEANHAACSLRTEEILLQASSHIADLASPSLPPVGDLDAAISSAAGPLRIAFISPNFRMSHPAGQQLSHLLRALQPWVYLQPANCHKLVNRTEDEDVMEVKEEGQKVGRGQEEEEEKCSPSMPRVVVYCFSYGTSGDQGGDGGKGGGDEEVDKPTSESLDLWTDPVCAGGLRHVTYVTPSQSLQVSATSVCGGCCRVIYCTFATACPLRYDDHMG